jgi:hypothetical protein
MDRLIDAVAAYLCQHRSVGLLRLTLDLTRRRPELFAEIGAVEVVKDAVALPTPGSDAWWRALTTVGEAVYALCDRCWHTVRGRGCQLARSTCVKAVDPAPGGRLTAHRRGSRLTYYFWPNCY